MNYKAKKAQGFTLIELLIALVIGSILIAAIGMAYVAVSQTIKTSKQLENAQEVLRYSSEVFNRSLKQTLSAPLVNPNNNGLTVIQTSEGATACDGSNPAVPFSEVYTFVSPNLICDAGNGEQVLLTGLADISYNLNGNLVEITVTPSELDMDMLLNGFQIDIALTGIILAGALK